jgi:hypothetical protein
MGMGYVITNVSAYGEEQEAVMTLRFLTLWRV